MLKNDNRCQNYNSANIEGCKFEFYLLFLFFRGAGQLFRFALSILFDILLVIPVLHNLSISSLK